MMTPSDYTALCIAVAGRPLGDLGLNLGQGMAAHLVPAGVDTTLRLAHFIAQGTHETGGFRTLVEYGGVSYFSKYDGRADLGNTQPGDGYRYRGRGVFQITGRANYATYGLKTKLDLVDKPDMAADPDVAVWTAALYWQTRGLSTFADKDDVVSITRRINGGLNGLDDRRVMLARAKAYLSLHPV